MNFFYISYLNKVLIIFFNEVQIYTRKFNYLTVSSNTLRNSQHLVEFELHLALI